MGYSLPSFSAVRSSGSTSGGKSVNGGCAERFLLALFPLLFLETEHAVVKSSGSCKVSRQQTRHCCGVRVQMVLVSSLRVRPT